MCLAFCPAMYSIRNTFVHFCYLLHTKFFWNESKYKSMPIFQFIEEFFSLCRNWSHLYLRLRFLENETARKSTAVQMFLPLANKMIDLVCCSKILNSSCLVFQLKTSRVKLWPSGKILSTFSHVVIITGSLPSLVQMVSK